MKYEAIVCFIRFPVFIIQRPFEASNGIHFISNYGNPQKYKEEINSIFTSVISTALRPNIVDRLLSSDNPKLSQQIVAANKKIYMGSPLS